MLSMQFANARTDDTCHATTQIFSLMPPADGWRMHLRQYPLAQYRQRGSRLVPELVDPPQQVDCHSIFTNIMTRSLQVL